LHNSASLLALGIISCPID